MGTQNLICLLLLLFLGTTLADIAMQENLNQIATEVVDKVEEFKEKCCEGCHHLVEVICETREDWWTALLAWLRSLGGSKGICDILQRLLDFTNSLIHLVNCSFSSNPDPECPGTFLANQLAWLKEQDVTNTDQLNAASKGLLVVVVISVHLALSALILTVLLPFTRNCFSRFCAKVEKVVAMTRRTGSTRRTRSTSRRTRSSSRRTQSSGRRAGSVPSGKASSSKQSSSKKSSLKETSSKKSSSKKSSSRRAGSVPSGSKLAIFSKAQAAGSGNLDFGQGTRKVKVEDAEVTGYEGYGKKSFIELPNTNKASSSKQSSSSADEEPVKIVIKEDISKRPSSKKSSSEKSSPKETSSKKSSSKKSSS